MGHFYILNWVNRLLRNFDRIKEFPVAYYNIIRTKIIITFKLRIQLSPYRLTHPHCSIFLLAETTECRCIVKRGQGKFQLLWQTATASLVLSRGGSRGGGG